METPVPPVVYDYPLEGTLSQKIDTFWELRNQKSEIEAELKKINARLSDYEEQVAADMDAAGLKSTGTDKATVSFTTSIVPVVQGDEGWDLLYKYIKKTGYFHLLFRRVTEASYRELLTVNAGKKDFAVPGVLPFMKRRVNMRTRSS